MPVLFPRQESYPLLQHGDTEQANILASQLREIEVAAFNARREVERHQTRNLVGEHAYLFSGGLGNALSNNLSLGAIPRDHLHHPAFLYGQMAGDGLSVVCGAAEFVIGKGMMFCGGLVMVASDGALVPVPYPLSAGGVAVVGPWSRGDGQGNDGV